MLELDHLAVGAATLEEGRESVENALGVSVQPGGQHGYFATHNLLLGLEDGLYLEVIAADPLAPALSYSRWFDLDRFAGPPRLSNWICRTADLSAGLTELPESGDPVSLVRGDLRWQMAVPESGVLPYDNLFPAIMEWQCTLHPATALRASGCRLRCLTLSHPEADALQLRIAGHLHDSRIRFEIGAPGMCADFETPHGHRVLQ